MIWRLLLGLLFVLLFVGPPIGWLIYCSSETGEDRRRMRSIINGSGLSKSTELSNAQQRVSQRRHFWHRVTFQDPRDLYPVELWPAFKRNTN